MHTYTYEMRCGFYEKKKIFLPAGCAALEIQEIGYIIINMWIVSWASHTYGSHFIS